MEREELIAFIRERHTSLSKLDLESLSTSSLALVKTYLDMEEIEHKQKPGETERKDKDLPG